jgi:excisionase family DNA binding protein
LHIRCIASLEKGHEKRKGGKNMELMMKKRMFRPDEVARILCLSRRTIYRMIRDGRLPAVRLGSGPWRIPREALLMLLPLPPGDFQRSPRESSHTAAQMRGAA